MSRWTLSIKPSAQKDLARLDPEIVRRILGKISWLEKNFESITPLRLAANRSGSYKLRVGDYRVLYETNYGRMLIYVYLIEHRSKVYKK